MSEFTKLETALLNWVAESFGNPDLTAQLESAVLTDREWTKVGFHIQLQVSNCCNAVNLKFPITGPHIESPQINQGAGSLICGQDGFINGIEIFAYGDVFAETIHEFYLRECPTVE